MLPIQKEVHAEHEETVAALQAEYEGISERLDAWKDRAEEVEAAIKADLRARMPRIERVPVPKPAIADEPEALFDSRSYPEQIFAYKRHGNGSNGHDDGHDRFMEELRLEALIGACRAMGVENADREDEDQPPDEPRDLLGDDDDDE